METKKGRYDIWHMAYGFLLGKIHGTQKEGIAWGDWCEKRERRREVDVLEWEETKVMFFHLKSLSCLCPPVFSFCCHIKRSGVSR